MIERDQVFDAPNFSGVLPASGAFTAQAVQPFPSQRIPRRLSVLCTLTKHASATTNAAKIAVQWQIGAGSALFYETFIDTSSPTIGAPFAEMPEYALVVVGPDVTAAESPFSYRALSLEVPSAATGVRVLAAEASDTTHPSTLRIDLAVSDVL